MAKESTAAITSWEALFRAQVTVLRQLNLEFPHGDLSFNEYDVLFNLSKHTDWKLRIRDLNREILLTQPSVSRLIDRLTARGLVRKESDPGDGRGTIVLMTQEGYDLFRKVAVTHSASIAHHVGGALSVEELTQLRELSEKLRRSVAEANP